MKRKKRARNMSQSEALREVEPLRKRVQELMTANLLLSGQNETLRRVNELHRQDAKRAEIDNEFLESRNRTLRHENERLTEKVAAAENLALTWEKKWRELWATFEKTVRQLGVLKSIASDVYDFCFEDDRDPHIRHLRRVLKVLGVFITRRDEREKAAR